MFSMDYISANILASTLAILLGYLFGSIPTSVLLGKWFYHKDLRKYGSGNPGGTNAGRVFGKKVGFIVIFLDILKTCLVFWITWLITRFSGIGTPEILYESGAYLPWLAVFFATIGHCYPVWLKFKGGKGVACFMGIVGGTSWLGFILCFVSFLSVLFLKKKIVSFSSLVSGAILLVFEIVMAIISFTTSFHGEILSWTFGLAPSMVYFGLESLLVTLFAYLVLVIRHIPNIKRLRNGTEKPANWSTRESDNI